MSKKAISALFWVAAVYDGVLGIVFLLDPGLAFRWLNVTPPNHFGYVQFPAALLLVFAAMFVAIARRPVENAALIPYGMFLKVAYCGVVFRYWLAQDIPTMWKPFAVADLAFLLLFVWAWMQLRRAPV
jgi:hypothetical protein